MSSNRYSKAVPLLLLFVACDGECGGGDGGGNGGVPPIPDISYCQDVQSDEQADTGDGGTGWPLDQSSLELAVATEVNTFRAGGGSCGGTSFNARQPLQPDGNAWCAARVHALDMNGAQPFMSDTGSNASSPLDRVQSTNSDASFVDHNVAFGFETARDVVDAWKRRPELCLKLINDDATKIGVGVVDDESRGRSWALVVTD